MPKRNKAIAFTETRQQDQEQSHNSPAALIGLGWVALQQEDWPAGRRHFAAALPLIVQLETAPQALDALAGIAHLQRQVGQLEQVLTLIGLVQQHPSSFQETKDRVAGLETGLRSLLATDTAQTASDHGRTSELWAVVVVTRDPLADGHGAATERGTENAFG